MAGATREDVISRIERLRAFAERRFNNAEDREDAVQHALAEVLADLSFIEREMVWRRLKELVKTYALAAERQVRRSNRHAVIKQDPRAPRRDTPAAVEDIEAMRHWRQEALEAVAELPDDLRQVFTLVSLEGKKVEVVARELNTSPAQVSRKHKSALSTLLGKLLRKGLERRDLFVLAPLFALIDWVRSKPKTAMASGLSLAAIVTMATLILGGDAEETPLLAQNSQVFVNAEDDNTSADSTHDPAQAKPANMSEVAANDAEVDAEGWQLEDYAPPTESARQRYLRGGLGITSVYTHFDGRPAQIANRLPFDELELETAFHDQERPKVDPISALIPRIKAGPYQGKAHGVVRQFERDQTLTTEWVFELGVRTRLRQYDAQERLVLDQECIDGNLGGATLRYEYQDDGTRKVHKSTRDPNTTITYKMPPWMLTATPMPVASLPEFLHRFDFFDMESEGGRKEFASKLLLAIQGSDQYSEADGELSLVWQETRDADISAHTWILRGQRTIAGQSEYFGWDFYFILRDDDKTMVNFAGETVAGQRNYARLVSFDPLPSEKYARPSKVTLQGAEESDKRTYIVTYD